MTPDVAEDARWMARAVALARVGLGTTGANPSVGCVLVRGGVVIAEAATATGGRPHAEEQALDAAGEEARGATAYVTLEPCAARSTAAPSCSERLVAAGVARVVIGSADRSSYAAGRGIERLRTAGLSVEFGVLGAETEALLANYTPAGLSDL